MEPEPGAGGNARRRKRRNADLPLLAPEILPGVQSVSVRLRRALFNAADYSPLMPSKSLQHWDAAACSALDEIEDCARGGRWQRKGQCFATLQINHAYLVMVSSHFQRFCRDLHTEALDHICRPDAAASSVPDRRRIILRLALSQNRHLDSKNPSSGALGADFGRLGFNLWDRIRARQHLRNDRRMRLLDELNGWRNAIAHQDFATRRLLPADLTLAAVRRFRNACHQLSRRMDAVICDEVAKITGRNPW